MPDTSDETAVDHGAVSGTGNGSAFADEARRGSGGSAYHEADVADGARGGGDDHDGNGPHHEHEHGYDEHGYDEHGYDGHGYDEHGYDGHDEHDYEVIRGGHASRGRKVFTVLLVLLVLLLGMFGAGALWLKRQIDPPGPAGAEIRLTIPTGSSTKAIGSLLQAKDVIPSATVFKYYVQMKSAGPFQAGEFVLKKNSALGDVIRVLERGPLPPNSVRVTIPEGLRLTQIVQRLADKVPSFSAERLNAVVASGAVRSAVVPDASANLEGFLFPETYDVGEKQDENAFLSTMIAQFDQVASAVGLDQAQTLVGVSPYEALIVASLVQEEAKIPEDAPKVARVIYNRLAAGTPLGVDATLCYGLNEQPCSLTRSELQRDNPYNSRIRKGLPPTPIAAPGRAALEAALHPAEGPWIYYVLDPDAAIKGGHFFTDSYSEFNRVKEKCHDAGLGCG